MTSQKALTVQKAKTIRSFLEGQRKQLAMAVPKHLPVDRLLRVAMTSIQQTPKLLDCTPVSLLRCVMTCASSGSNLINSWAKHTLCRFGIARKIAWRRNLSLDTGDIYLLPGDPARFNQCRLRSSMKEMSLF